MLNSTAQQGKQNEKCPNAVVRSLHFSLPLRRFTTHLRHLTDAQCETARLLRDTLAHYCAAEHVKPQAGLERIVREQAFTVLNRLAALRMAETRGLLIESVGNAYQAKGFQLYSRLAGAGLGETGDIERLGAFDDEMGVVFD